MSNEPRTITTKLVYQGFVRHKIDPLASTVIRELWGYDDQYIRDMLQERLSKGEEVPERLIKEYSLEIS